jgi:3-hydroxyisobutyrate dehydrogenase
MPAVAAGTGSGDGGESGVHAHGKRSGEKGGTEVSLRAVGFIGLGEMGFPMARNLVNAGYLLHVFDVVEEPLHELREMGARIVDSPSAAAQGSEVIIVMVRTTEQAEDVISGTDGVLAGANKGSVVLVMSTIDPKVARRLSTLAIERGVDLLDAPVSGAKEGAEAGTLTIMVGGAEAALGRVRPVLGVLGKRVFHLGAVGTGEVAKLINNLLLLVNMIGVYEAMSLARHAGIETRILRELIQGSTGNSWVIEQWETVTSWKEHYREGGTLDLIYKDANLALKLGEELRVPLHLASLAKQLGRY